MRPVRSIIAGLLIALIGVNLPGCALIPHHKPKSTLADEACLNAGCDRPFEELLALLGPGCDLKYLAPGRKITLRECIASALRKGRLNDESLRVKEQDLRLALEEARLEGKSRLQKELLQLNLEKGIQDLVLNVEFAYWRLLQARGNLISREDTVRALDEEERNVRARFEEKLLSRQDVATLEELRQAAQAERLDALAKVVEAERTLRRTAGLWPWDTTTLEPCDPPGLVPPVCDSREDLYEARFFRPELLIARVNVEIACEDLKNLKVEKARPLARLKVCREETALREAEEVTVFDLQRTQGQLVAVWQSFEIFQAREAAAHDVLTAVQEKWQSKEFGELKELLRAQTGLSTARRDTLQAVTDYQQALADYRRRKGVLLKHHSVCIERTDQRPVPGD